MDDRGFLEKLVMQDKLAQAQFYETHYAVIFKFCRRILKNRELAEDLVQESFMKFFKTIKSFRGECTLKSWLCTITLNLCRSALKKEKRLNETEGQFAFESSSLPDQSLDDARFLQALVEEVNKLPLKQREIFVMRYFEQTPMMDIASDYNDKYDTVKANCRHAYLKIRKSLRERGINLTEEAPLQ